MDIDYLLTFLADSPAGPGTVVIDVPDAAGSEALVRFPHRHVDSTTRAFVLSRDPGPDGRPAWTAYTADNGHRYDVVHWPTEHAAVADVIHRLVRDFGRHGRQDPDAAGWDVVRHMELAETEKRALDPVKKKWNVRLTVVALAFFGSIIGMGMSEEASNGLFAAFSLSAVLFFVLLMVFCVMVIREQRAARRAGLPGGGIPAIQPQPDPVGRDEQGRPVTRARDPRSPRQTWLIRAALFAVVLAGLLATVTHLDTNGGRRGFAFLTAAVVFGLIRWGQYALGRREMRHAQREQAGRETSPR